MCSGRSETAGRPTLWDDVIIDLQAEQFGPAERVLARHAGLTASVFRYGSGVAGSAPRQ